MAVDSRQRHVGDGVGIDCSAFYRIDIPLFCGKLPYKAIWLQFCHHQYHAGACHYADRISGRSELAFAVFGLSVSFCISFPYSLSEKDLSNYHSSDDIPADTVREMGKRGINVKALVKLMAFYGLATYLVIIISFNLPFLMEEYGLSSGRAGILISLFFLAIMAPGFVLNKIVQVLDRRIYMVCLLMIACGMGIILLSRSEILIALGCILNGLSYGIIQPLIYDKTSDVAVPHKVTLALAFVMAMNYVAILLCPFIVDAFQNLFHSHSQTFAFWLNLMVALMGMFIVMKQEKLSL